MNRPSGSFFIGAIAVIAAAVTSSSFAADEPSPQNPGVFAREIWTRPGTPESLKDGTAFQGEPQRRELVAAPVGATDAGVDGVAFGTTNGVFQFTSSKPSVPAAVAMPQS